MKRVDLGSRFKHQTLIQDYHELHQVTEATRGKLEIIKQKKLTLLAEVRFLRRRYKYLLENKPNTPQERVLIPQQNLENKRKTKAKMGPVLNKKEGNLRNVPVVLNQNRKLNVRTQNLMTSKNFKAKVSIPSKKESKPVLDLNQRALVYRGKEPAIQDSISAVDYNQGRMYGGDGGVGLRNPLPLFDLNQNESFLGGKQGGFQRRMPVFDLNQISTGEEDFEEISRFDEPKKGIIRGGNEETLNDLKLSICRNVGETSNRAGKRKISWQDPVALRV